MQYRNGLSSLGFGCMRLPGRFADAEELIVRAVEKGINYFDTAYMYGTNEETLGEILKKNNLRDQVNIATKLPILFCKSGADFDKYFDRELSRLQTGYVD